MNNMDWIKRLNITESKKYEHEKTLLRALNQAYPQQASTIHQQQRAAKLSKTKENIKWATNNPNL